MGQSRLSYFSEALEGLVIVVKSTNGCLLGWLEANEMWSAGCQSFVAILRAKGRVKRVLIMGIVERPSGTARLPFWGLLVDQVGGDEERREV